MSYRLQFTEKMIGAFTFGDTDYRAGFAAAAGERRAACSASPSPPTTSTPSSATRITWRSPRATSTVRCARRPAAGPGRRVQPFR